MFLHYIKVAFRNLRKYKSQTIIGVLGLTTACVVFAIICYLIFTFSLSQNTEFPNNERMYELRTNNYQTSIKGNMKRTLGELNGVEKFTAFNHRNIDYGRLRMEENKPERLIKLQLVEADTTFWSFFSLNALIGNVKTILNTPNSIVLYEETAKQYGAPDALQGRSIIIKDVAYTITGILKNRRYAGGDGLVFNQKNGYFQQIHETWNPHSPTVLIMLTKGISKNNFQSVLDAYPFVFDADPNSHDNEHLYIASIRGEFGLVQIFILSLVIVIGLMILSVALFNIISFQTAQFYNRLKECAIRKLVGSSRRQLLLSFYMEIIIIFVLSYFLGLIVIDFLKSILLQFGFDIPIMGSIGEMAPGIKKYLLFSSILGLVITFLFCLIPVQMISRQSVRVAFLGLSEKVSKQRGRKIMLFLQMFFMLLFLSTTLVIRLQVNKVKDNIWHTLSIEDRKNIFSFSFDKEIMPEELFNVILQQLKQSSAVDDIFFSDNSFYGRYGYLYNTTVDKHENQTVREYRVSNNFANIFNAKMIKGRFWNENDAPDVAVVDETLAALFPDNNPLGMNINGKTIIGVVENIQMLKENQSYNCIKRPVFYSPVNKAESSMLGIYVKAVPDRREEVRKLITQIKKEFYPEFSQVYTDFQTEISYVLIEEDMFSRLFGIFSAICLILCLLSIYSAITMSTEKRRKEVAIRKINGAEIKDIILLFSKTYILLWSSVCLLLFPVIYFAGNLWLKTFTQRISLNIFFFSGIYFSILALIFLIVIFRIMEVARCNPADVLKKE